MAKKTDNKIPTTKKVKPAKVKEEMIAKTETPVEFEPINGDPAVVVPVENNQENKEESMENNSFHSFGPKKPIMDKKKNEDNPHKTTSLVPEKNTEEVQLEEWDNVKPARQKVENKPRSSSFKKIVDYFWNGQEMDF